ncbi:phosphotransferase family protein [Bosea sp. SSUT16]|uniref:Phosphotransferase family protein n=1 Tax=Bosea spartocytisi TaxID=2773451 RepID=A0A927ECC3_9HYPH|nr:phosphotransferase family protein [Bosea spartocytisi]MBD3848100.1 phosphotransferase family protein [Bosea spartocytisi]MCT4473951.1 phosphotransferase family protein [Bosea spartocytisi]
MDRQPDQRPVTALQNPTDRPATPDELRAWIEAQTGGAITSWTQISGGNRCRSWAVDVASASEPPAELYLRYQPPRPPSAEPYTVWREAQFYRALASSPVPAPKLIAVHPESQAILTERAPGRADYRRIADDAARTTIAREFVQALATLHRTPVARLDMAGFDPRATLADCVRQELAIWRAMYAETRRLDPLIAFALDWLDDNVPATTAPPVLVHGDAGPGNFLFDEGHLTALLDWELAHPGDPMEDLAWFSMRCVMEPVPDFPARLREYGEAMGTPVDLDRIRYHRVFVSTRVVIIRHRNVTGLPGNSIVSRALNRRLLVTALAEATATTLAPPARMDAPETERSALFDFVLHELRHDIAEASDDAGVVAAAKNMAKVVKYLRECDRIGPLVAAAELEALTGMLSARPSTVPEGMAALADRLQAGDIPFTAALQFFAGSVARDAELAASASGGLAGRDFPPLTEMNHV